MSAADELRALLSGEPASDRPETLMGVPPRLLAALLAERDELAVKVARVEARLIRMEAREQAADPLASRMASGRVECIEGQDGRFGQGGGAA